MLTLQQKLHFKVTIICPFNKSSIFMAFQQVGRIKIFKYLLIKNSTGLFFCCNCCVNVWWKTT